MALNESIFVSIASYRDSDCNKTIEDLFVKARLRSRITVGIYQQNKEEGETCLYKNSPSKTHVSEIGKVKEITMDYKEAKGPWYARKKVCSLYEGQAFFLQIDSHTRFVEDWDDKLILMFYDLKKQGVEKPVISYYPHETVNMQSVEPNYVPFINDIKVDEKTLIPMFSKSEAKFTDGKMKLSRFSTGGFLFGSGDITQLYQEDFKGLFQGEEIVMSILLYTNGYDVYVPRENIAFHEYVRKESPKYWDDVPDTGFDRQESEKRVVRFLKRQLNIEGLGKKRTVQEFLRYCKIDHYYDKPSDEFNFNVYVRKNPYCRYTFIVILIVIIFFTVRYSFKDFDIYKNYFKR